MHRRQKPISILVLLALSAMAILAAACDKQAAQPEEYEIGVVLALTGRGATYGQDSLNGMQLALDEVNEEAKKNGGPHFRMTVEDSKSTGQQSVEALRKLIDQNKVFVAVGFTLSDEALNAAPLAEQRKVLLLSPSAVSDDLKNAGDYVFRNREGAATQAEAIARAAVERFGKQKLAVLHSNSANGISYRDGFVNAVVALGAPTPSTVDYDEGKTDYKADIERLRALSPEGVYLTGLDKEMGLILKQANEMGFKPQFFASAGAISQRLLDTAGAGAEGLVCGSAPFDPKSNEPHVQAFVKAYKERFGADPDFFAANSYDAIKLVTGFIREGATDADSLKARLYQVKDYDGIGGKTTFDQYGEVSKPIALVQVHNGEFQKI
ncbi:MAG TPA: ABC transporter substrate-binding protein [Thermoanaerobaculia bacterium]|nr:ABC transporter substrate-binding protein [Thermoanaerobaculia bacterium]